GEEHGNRPEPAPAARSSASIRPGRRRALILRRLAVLSPRRSGPGGVPGGPGRQRRARRRAAAAKLADCLLGVDGHHPAGPVARELRDPGGDILWRFHGPRAGVSADRARLLAAPLRAVGRELLAAAGPPARRPELFSAVLTAALRIPCLGVVCPDLAR